MSEYELLAEQSEYFRFEKRPMVETGPHFHRAIELLFATDGRQKVVVGGKTRVLNVGEGCFSDSFCVHSYEKNEKVPSCYIVGDRAYFERFFTRKGGKTPPSFFKFDNFALLKALLAICNKKYKNQADRYASIEGAMHILLAEIAENNPFVFRENDRRDTLVRDVLLYADEHFAEDLSLQTLAKVFCVSREHLSRVLHKHLTENWNTYVGRLRVKKSKSLLQERTDLSVVDIAFLCGFESANTFYRAYKREFGNKPRQKTVIKTNEK